MASPRKKNLRRRLGLHHTLVAPVETAVVEEPVPVSVAPEPAPLPAKSAASKKPAAEKARKKSKRPLHRLRKSKKV